MISYSLSSSYSSRVLALDFDYSLFDVFLEAIRATVFYVDVEGLMTVFFCIDKSKL